MQSAISAPEPLPLSMGCRVSNPALLWAAKNGNIATARLSLKARLPEKTYHKRWEYLYVATLRNQQAIVRLLLEHGIDPNRVAYWDTEAKASSEAWNDDSINLVEEATRVGSEPIVKLLLDHGAVTDRLTFKAMLTYTVRRGHLGITKLLMENGCGLGSIDLGEKQDALCKAIEAGSTSVVRFLLEKGVFPEIQPVIRPPGRSSMALAACLRDPEIAKMLLAHGANPFPEEPAGINVLPLANASTLENYAVAQLLRESIDLQEMIRSRGRNQELLLLSAAACGWDDMVEQILGQGCPVDTMAAIPYPFFSTKSSGLFRERLPAISLAAGRGHYSTVQLLLSYNASYNPPSKYEDPFPLLHAVASGHLDIVELLLNHGAEPNGIGRWHCCQKEVGDLPCIYWAVKYPEIFGLLLDRGADLLLPAAKARIRTERDPETDAITVIHHMPGGTGRMVTEPTSTFVIQNAIETGCTEAVQILLERGIPLPTIGADHWDRKSFLVAVMNGGEAMARLVLDHGLNVSPGGRDAEEAIHIAVLGARFPVFKLLLDRGLLNSPSASPGDRNILGMAIPTSPTPKTDTTTGVTTSDLPPEDGAYSKLRNSPLEKSPLDHLIKTGVAPGPGNTDIFVQFLLEQGAEPLAGSSVFQTPLAIATERGYYHLVWLMLRVIDRQTITQEELILKLGALFIPETPDVTVDKRLAAYYAKRTRNLYRK